VLLGACSYVLNVLNVINVKADTENLM